MGCPDTFSNPLLFLFLLKRPKIRTLTFPATLADMDAQMSEFWPKVSGETFLNKKAKSSKEEALFSLPFLLLPAWKVEFPEVQQPFCNHEDEEVGKEKKSGSPMVDSSSCTNPGSHYQMNE